MSGSMGDGWTCVEHPPAMEPLVAQFNRDVGRWIIRACSSPAAGRYKMSLCIWMLLPLVPYPSRKSYSPDFNALLVLTKDQQTRVVQSQQACPCSRLRGFTVSIHTIPWGWISWSKFWKWVEEWEITDHLRSRHLVPPSHPSIIAADNLGSGIRVPSTLEFIFIRHETNHYCLPHQGNLRCSRIPLVPCSLIVKFSCLIDLFSFAPRVAIISWNHTPYHEPVLPRHSLLAFNELFAKGSRSKFWGKRRIIGYHRPTYPPYPHKSRRQSSTPLFQVQFLQSPSSHLSSRYPSPKQCVR